MLQKCKRCGGHLSNPKSQEQGYGNVCYHKMLKEKIDQTEINNHIEERTGEAE